MSGFSITRRAAISAIDSFRHAPEAVELSIIASFRRVIQPLTSFRTSIPSLAKHTDHELSRFVFRTWETSLPTRSRRPLAERSEERRGGKECVSTCRYRWSPYPTKNKYKEIIVIDKTPV